MKIKTVLPDGKVVITEGTGEAYQSGVFEGAMERDCDRYATIFEAHLGHVSLVNKWKDPYYKKESTRS